MCPSTQILTENSILYCNRMKGIRHILIAMLTVLAAISCSKEGQDAFVEVTLDYSVTAADQTKAYGEGDAVTHIWYALYRKLDNTFVRSFTPAPMVGGMASCPVTLVMNQEYKLVFVGMNYEMVDGKLTPPYSIQKEHATISMPATSVANSEKLECFYGIDEVQVNKKDTGTSIQLERIVSQVNLLCKENAWKSEYATATSGLKLFGVSKTFNLLNQSFSGKEDVVYAQNTLLSAEYFKSGTDYSLCSVYTFAAEGVNAEFSFMSNGLTETFSVTGLPLATNTRTNIYVK